MKKIYFLLIALIAGYTSDAQTVLNAGMEAWRTNTAGPVLPKTIQAPVDWFGTDSLVISVGQAFIGDTNLAPQLFREDVIVNSGAHSAKVMTLFQDTLQNFPGVLTNAQEKFDVSVLLIPGKTIADAISFSGGTPVTLKITTVSAYVEYLPGIDTTTHLMGGADTGALTVQVYGFIHGVDTLLGTGFAQIPPSNTFTKITATIAYADTVDSVGLVRMFFASSGGGFAPNLDSSTLYVDDVSMTGEPEPPPIVNAVKNVALNNLIKVYPNPATGILYVAGPQNTPLTCTLFAVNGQVVKAKAFTGNESLDISYLPGGLYFYAITDEQGATVQRGKVSVDR